MAPLILGVILFVVIYLIFHSSRKSKKVIESRTRAPARSFKLDAGPRPIIDDYNDYLLSTGLEQGVVDSHRQFVNDIQHTTTGASSRTIFSEEPDLAPWVGLRRPNYQSVNIDPNSRQVPSVEQYQMPSNYKYDRCGLY